MSVFRHATPAPRAQHVLGVTSSRQPMDTGSYGPSRQEATSTSSQRPTCARPKEPKRALSAYFQRGLTY